MDEITTALTPLDEPRLMQETGNEARIAAVIEPVIKPLGFRLVRIRLSGLNGLTLQIMAERADGTMTIEDCELVSRTVSPMLDVEDLIEHQYHLEVSSPGIDRPLVRKSDFASWHGHIVKAETGVMIDGRKRFHGYIADVDNESFTLETDKTAYGKTMMVRIPFIDLSEARLVLTDELIRDALRKDKTLREQLIDDNDSDTDMRDDLPTNDRVETLPSKK